MPAGTGLANDMSIKYRVWHDQRVMFSLLCPPHMGTSNSTIRCCSKMSGMVTASSSAARWSGREYLIGLICSSPDAAFSSIAKGISRAMKFSKPNRSNTLSRAPKQLCAFLASFAAFFLSLLSSLLPEVPVALVANVCCCVWLSIMDVTPKFTVALAPPAGDRIVMFMVLMACRGNRDWLAPIVSVNCIDVLICVDISIWPALLSGSTSYTSPGFVTSSSPNARRFSVMQYRTFSSALAFVSAGVHQRYFSSSSSFICDFFFSSSSMYSSFRSMIMVSVTLSTKQK
mmetsp:Transcript_19279/g.57739  ORF Transcript_19279/g.57739 Transcript_19279/m.57739 type:complete len:286 (+) Transcript_19279:5453-6310(+)